MKHVGALLIKLLILEVVATLLLVPLTDASLGEAWLVGLVTTLLLYVIGDLMVLPAMGNTAAVLGDAGIALLAVWLAPAYTGIESVSFWTALVTAAVIGLVESFFHTYIRRAVLPGPPASNPNEG